MYTNSYNDNNEKSLAVNSQFVDFEWELLCVLAYQARASTSLQVLLKCSLDDEYQKKPKGKLEWIIGLCRITKFYPHSLLTLSAIILLGLSSSLSSSPWSASPAVAVGKPVRLCSCEWNLNILSVHHRNSIRTTPTSICSYSPKQAICVRVCSSLIILSVVDLWVENYLGQWNWTIPNTVPQKWFPQETRKQAVKSDFHKRVSKSNNRVWINTTKGCSIKTNSVRKCLLKVGYQTWCNLCRNHNLIAKASDHSLLMFCWLLPPAEKRSWSAILIVGNYFIIFESLLAYKFRRMASVLLSREVRRREILRGKHWLP